MRFFSFAFVSVLCGALWGPAASARPAAGLTTNNSLVFFDTDAPATIVKGPIPITGLLAGQELVDIDVRPSNGLLYGVTNSSGVCTIDVGTGVATFVSQIITFPAGKFPDGDGLVGNEFGIDFNPQADLLRIVSDADQNLRVNVDTGSATIDGTLAYAVGDANDGANPNVTANAYTNSVVGANGTTLFGLDFATRNVVIQNAPNSGTLNTVPGGALPAGSTTISGFDIASQGNSTDGFSNQAFAALTPSSAPSGSTVGSINLSTGAFSPLGTVGGGAPLRGLALLSALPEASSLRVTTTNDTVNAFDNQTSLREAINYANSNPGQEIISFGPLFNMPQTIILNGELNITSDIVILPPYAGEGGPHPELTTLLTLDGNNQNRIFNISEQGRLLGAGLTLRNGNGFNGGAIYNAGRLQLNNSTLSGNSASGNSVTGNGGAIYNTGTMQITNSLFENNDATGNGGAVASSSAVAGELEDPTGDAVLHVNTFTGNSAGGRGGAVFNGEGSIDVWACTIAGNTAPQTQGGGLFVADGATTKVLSSIIVGNAGGDVNVASPSASLLSTGYNLVGSGSGAANFGEATDTKGATLASSGLATQDGAPLLADNNGPTRTIALLPNSPAIDKGELVAGYDQRGYETSAGKGTDIGAFEYVSSAPEVVYVDPIGGNRQVAGQAQTFEMRVRDGDGVGDIKEMWLMINTTLDWNGGATLVYLPQSGQLYLRQGDSFGTPIKIGSAAGENDVLDNGALRIRGRDVFTTTSDDGTALTLYFQSVVRNGLVGQNTLFGRGQDVAGQVDAASLPGEFGFVRFGNYTVTPQFKSGANRIPTLSPLSPKAANTVIPTTGTKLQTFVFYAKDEDGIGDLDSLWFVAGKQRDWTRNATFVFIPRTRRLYLRSNDGRSFIGGGRVGSSGIIENSQVKVDLSQVQYLIYADGKSVGLRLNLQPKAGLIGQNNIWLRVQDNSGATSTGGDNLGFVQSGTWNVTRQSSSTLNAAAPSAPGS